MVEADGYILRIATKQWVEQVFNMAIYYTNARRKWKPGQTILFMHKTGKGDAVVGYGEIGNLYSIDELSEEEKLECEKHGWKKAIEFTYVKEFENPLSIKDTFLKDLKIRGKYFHGFPLKREQITSIIEQAENR
ncbi:MAG: EVE domain-containing protein [Candidatus Bathyarchaeia archaeon]